MKKLVLTAAIVFVCLRALVWSADWHQIKTPAYKGFEDMHFINDSLGFLCCKSGVVLKVHESQYFWKTDSIKLDGILKGICFSPDGRFGCAFGPRGMIFKTEDTGKTWVSDSLGYHWLFNDMVFVDSVTGFLVGINRSTSHSEANGVALKTVDGGRSWDSLGLVGWNFNSIKESSDGTIAITGRKKLLYSTDGGQSWEFCAIPPKITPKATMIEDLYGMMVGMGGYHAYTHDGGQTWTKTESLPKTFSLFDILLLDSLEAYVVGVNGLILYTDDDGLNWIPEISNAGYDLIKIQKANRRIFICGTRGTIIYADPD